MLSAGATGTRARDLLPHRKWGYTSLSRSIPGPDRPLCASLADGSAGLKHATETRAAGGHLSEVTAKRTTIPATSESDWLKRRHSITEEDAVALRAFGVRLLPKIARYIERFYAWMQKQPEYAQFFGDRERLHRAQHMQTNHWQHFFQANLDEDYLKRRRHVGEVHARIGLSLPSYFAGLEQTSQIFIDLLAEDRLDLAEHHRLIASLNKWLRLDASLVVDSYAKLSATTISEQTRALMEMSTPVTSLWDDILMLPIVGLVDSKRAQEIMTSSLDRIAASRAKVFIMDISGVSVVDTAVANHIIKIIRATRLLGCQSILSGLSPAVAETLVELGVDIGHARTVSTLRDALSDAFHLLGYRVEKMRDAGGTSLR